MISYMLYALQSACMSGCKPYSLTKAMTSWMSTCMIKCKAGGGRLRREAGPGVEPMTEPWSSGCPCYPE